MAKKLPPRKHVFVIEALKEDRTGFRTPVYFKLDRARPTVVLTTVDAFTTVQFPNESIAEEFIQHVRAAKSDVEWRVSIFALPYTKEQIAEMRKEEEAAE